MASVLSRATIVAHHDAAGLGAEKLGWDIVVAGACDRDTVGDPVYREHACSVCQGHHMVRFSATRYGMGVDVEGAEAAFAFVARMRSLDDIVAEVAMAVHQVNILQSHDVVV